MEKESRRTLYRYVDWNQEVAKNAILQKVVPYIGTWIETIVNVEPVHSINVVPYIGTWIETEEGGADSSTPSRTLYRYVDWNIVVAIYSSSTIPSYLI